MTIDTTPLAGYQQAVARVREITAPLQPAQTAGTTAATADDFATQLGSALSDATGAQQASSIDPAALAGNAGTGQKIAAIATAELGVAEQPPGSNDAPRIAQYRTATTGSGVGPWCAYFTSWVAQQAGVPVGPSGQGIGYVPTVKQLSLIHI